MLALEALTHLFVKLDTVHEEPYLLLGGKEIPGNLPSLAAKTHQGVFNCVDALQRPL